VRDEVLPFAEFHGAATVALDRVYASKGGATVHVITPTEHYGRGMVNQVEQIAEILRQADPLLNGLVLFWPEERGQRPHFLVPLFRVEFEARGIAQGRTVVMTDAGVAVDHTRVSNLTTHYADPDFGHCEPAELADALGVPAAELELLMPEIHQRAAVTPGWWEACAEADKRSDTAFGEFGARLREWDLD